MLRIWSARVEPGAGEPGVILRADAHGIVVGTGDGRLVITELQVPGGKRLSSIEYITGHPLAPGERLG
jgi:methionyl-tRNA formyltransferase